MSGDSEKDIGKLEGQMEQLVEDVRQVMALLIGSDQKAGMLERIVRQDDQLKQLIELTKEYNGTGTTIKRDLQTIKECVQNHANDKDIHSWRMVLNKKIIAFILGAFVFLHALIENGGPIWDKFKAVFGF